MKKVALILFGLFLGVPGGYLRAAEQAVRAVTQEVDWRTIIQRGDCVEVQRLIDAGVDFLRLDLSVNDRPLSIACNYHNVGIARLLIERGADPRLVCQLNQYNALHVARNVDFARFLIENYNDLVTARTRLGCTVFHIAICNNCSLEFKQLLLDAGIDVNSRNYAGNTLLHQAVKQHDSEIFQLLLARGADETIRNNSGQTAQDLIAQEAIRYPSNQVDRMRRLFAEHVNKNRR